MRNGVNNGHTKITTTFVITDGPNAVRHFEFSRGHRLGGHAAGAVKVERVETISDTIGAGDSFVAGYLSAELKGKGVKDSIEEGVRKMTVLPCTVMFGYGLQHKLSLSLFTDWEHLRVCRMASQN